LAGTRLGTRVSSCAHPLGTLAATPRRERGRGLRCLCRSLEGALPVSDQVVRLVAFGVLLLHGLGHGGALGAMAWIALRPGSDTGAWTAARSWLWPSAAPETATLAASAFWIVSLIGFVIAALAFWFGWGDAWQPRSPSEPPWFQASASSACFGTWPMFNTTVAARRERRRARGSPATPLGAAGTSGRCRAGGRAQEWWLGTMTTSYGRVRSQLHRSRARR
jgi:hypothetical protein